MESGAFLLLRRDGAVGKVFVDKRFPAGDFFIATIHTEIHGNPHGATDIMARDRIVRERIRVVTMVVMTVHIVEETPHMLAQGVIEDQDRVSLRTAHCLRLLEQIHEPTVIDAVLEPRRFREGNRSPSQKILARLDIYRVRSSHGYALAFTTSDLGS